MAVAAEKILADRRDCRGGLDSLLALAERPVACQVHDRDHTRVPQIHADRWRNLAPLIPHTGYDGEACLFARVGFPTRFGTRCGSRFTKPYRGEYGWWRWPRRQAVGFRNQEEVCCGEAALDVQGLWSHAYGDLRDRPYCAAGSRGDEPCGQFGGLVSELPSTKDDAGEFVILYIIFIHSK